MGGIRKRTVHCGRYGKKSDFITASYYPHTGRREKGRRRKFNESTPQQKTLNDKKSKRYLEALIQTNFGKDDLCVHLTYRDDDMPQTIKEAQQRAKNYIRCLNRARKKNGIPNVKYIIITEMSGKGRIHHHVMMDGEMDRDMVENKWAHGWANAKRLKPDKKTGLADISGYVSKAPKSARKKKGPEKPDDERPKGGKRWISSQNLQKPWVSISDDPHGMSRKKFNALQELPEDSEMTQQIIERDNPGYSLIEIEKEYNEEYGKWYVFAKLRAKQLSTGKSQEKSG